MKERRREREEEFHRKRTLTGDSGGSPILRRTATERLCRRGKSVENERSAPRILLIAEYNDQSWFIDDRLRQFCDVWNPHNCVDIETAQGQVMLAAWGRAAPSRSNNDRPLLL